MGLPLTLMVSACKRDLRDLAWEVARRNPRVMRVDFIGIYYNKNGDFQLNSVLKICVT